MGFGCSISAQFKSPKGTNFAAEVLSALSLIQCEGVCTIVPAGEDRILAVRVGDFCFGELIDKSDETDVQ